MATYFAIFLVLLSLTSGLVWLLDSLLLAPRRKAKLAGLQAATKSVDEETKIQILRQSTIVETAASIFPVVLLITIFRSFIYEPFQIPSGSMKPTLLVGDFILVEKFSYGIKDPVWRNVLVETGTPQRGDIAVFKFPTDDKIDYIKRIIGLPGDTVRYKDKALYVKPACEREPAQCEEFQKIETKLLNQDQFFYYGRPLNQLSENLLGVEHGILVNPWFPDRTKLYYKQPQTSLYEWVVPKGNYFAMGDNRDNSTDSRFWGFVPDKNLVGKAVFIWVSFEFSDDPDNWLPSFIPVDIRFSRLGGIH